MSDRTNVARLPANPAPMADIDFPAMINMVLERGLDVSVIQSLLQTYNDHQDRRNQEALNAAVADVCADIQPVLRDAENKHLGNRYASHQGIMTMLQPVLAEHGVRVGFDVGALPHEHAVEPGYVRVRIVIGYGGFVDRNSYIDEPISQVGSQGGRTQMTQNQALTSATTYAQRTLLKLKFNISYQDEDDDGEGARVRDTQGSERAETQQRQGQADMTQPRPIDHRANLKQLEATLSEIKTEGGIQKLLSNEGLNNWLTNAPAEVKVEANVLLGARRKFIAEATAKAKAEREAAEALERDLAQARGATAGTTAGTQAGQAGEQAEQPAGQSTGPSPALAELLDRIAKCADIASLDACVTHDQFTLAVARMNFSEADQVTQAAQARAAELGATR